MSPYGNLPSSLWMMGISVPCSNRKCLNTGKLLVGLGNGTLWGTSSGKWWGWGENIKISLNPSIPPLAGSLNLNVISVQLKYVQ